jgi:hypothetical protein
MIFTNTYIRWKGRMQQYMWIDNPILPCILTGMKRSHLCCRKLCVRVRACVCVWGWGGVLRHVPALFYTSPGLQNTAKCMNQCIKMSLCQKTGKNVFSYSTHALMDSLSSCSLLPFPSSLPSYCDVAPTQELLYIHRMVPPFIFNVTHKCRFRS